MTKTIKKRNGDIVDFDIQKILHAAQQAYDSVNQEMTENVRNKILEHKYRDAGTVEEVNNSLQTILYHWAPQKVYNSFILYRAKREAARRAIHGLDVEVGGVSDGTNIEAINENSNKDARLNSTQRDLSAGTYSRGFARRNLMPADVMEWHDKGFLHFHDLDYALVKSMLNCCLVNIYDMLWNGTVVNGKMIERPHSIQTAANVATQVVLQIANNQYGGCSMNLADLAPWVDVTRLSCIEETIQDLHEAGMIDTDPEKVMKIAERKVIKAINTAMQTIQYQINTFSSLNGQSPFVSLFLWVDPGASEQLQQDTALLIKATLEQRKKGIKNEVGRWTTPEFPKLLFVTDENNLKKGSKFYYLKRMACDCTAHRMNPDYMSAKMLRDYKEGNVFACMGCRSLLSPWKDKEGNYKFWGRANRGVVSLNIPDAALTAKQEGRDFWEVLNERLEMCKKALIVRDSWLRGSSVNTSPIHWKHGGLTRKKEGTIDEFLDGGYTTISLGYIGVSETAQILTGHNITAPEGHDFALKLMKYLNSWCVEHAKEPHLNGLALYGTPAESLCYRFARTIMKRFGEIPGIIDHEHRYLTNSYHVNVRQLIDAFTKIDLESELQLQSMGGAISYVEAPDLTANIDAVEALVDYAYDKLIYFEINLRGLDQCDECGYEGTLIFKDGAWTCPKCGCNNLDKLKIERRTCGYLPSGRGWNAGKTDEINDRVLHLG